MRPVILRLQILEDLPMQALLRNFVPFFDLEVPRDSKEDPSLHFALSGQPSAYLLCPLLVEEIVEILAETKGRQRRGHHLSQLIRARILQESD